MMYARSPFLADVARSIRLIPDEDLKGAQAPRSSEKRRVREAETVGAAGYLLDLRRRPAPMFPSARNSCSEGQDIAVASSIERRPTGTGDKDRSRGARTHAGNRDAGPHGRKTDGTDRAALGWGWAIRPTRTRSATLGQAQRGDQSDPENACFVREHRVAERRVHRLGYF